MPAVTLERVFAAFVQPEPLGDYSVSLVNTTQVTYRKVVTLTGMFTSVDDGLLESTRSRADRGELRPQSAVLLENGDYRDLDFVIWYHLDLFPADTARPPERVWFQFGKLFLSNRGAPERLPLLNCEGWAIDLRPREDTSDL